jgi:RNA recognition motif-containing protein
MTESYEDVFAKLNSFWNDDPIMQAMSRGEIAWGDLDLYYPEIAQKEKEQAARAAAEPAEDDPVTPVKVKQERTVPEFAPGIRTVITRNLPRDITVDMLRGAFERYGPIKDIYIPKNMDKSSPYFGTVKGFALIKFLKPEHSAKAFTAEYGRLRFGKNNITVEFAKEDR